MRAYLAVTGVLNLAWETAQLPLYTIWKEDTPGRLVFTVLHCTAGDVVLASLVLVGTLLLAGTPEWPRGHAARIAVPALVAGLACTIGLEWLNVEVWHNWAYSDLMPTMPPFGTGLSPLIQWLLIPTVALRTAHHFGSARTRAERDLADFVPGGPRHSKSKEESWSDKDLP